MRGLAWLTFGSSNHRKHQILRRKEIVQANIAKIKKRSSSYNRLSLISSISNNKSNSSSPTSNDIKKILVNREEKVE
jgi:hypothetical protein